LELFDPRGHRGIHLQDQVEHAPMRVLLRAQYARVAQRIEGDTRDECDHERACPSGNNERASQNVFPPL
jgi:hypothetical protein